MKIMRPKKVVGGAGGGGQCEVDAGGRWAVQIGSAKMRAGARARAVSVVTVRCVCPDVDKPQKCHKKCATTTTRATTTRATTITPTVAT